MTCQNNSVVTKLLKPRVVCQPWHCTARIVQQNLHKVYIALWSNGPLIKKAKGGNVAYMHSLGTWLYNMSFWYLKTYHNIYQEL